MASYFGQIDFTILSRLWRDHKELFKMVDFKDGKHALLNVNFNERQQPDDHGNTHYMQAALRKDDRREGVDYYIGSHFKPSAFQQQSQPQQPQPQQASSESDLPF